VHEFFRRAINPQPEHVCLRLRLLPLTLGHFFLLYELDCPAVEGKFEGMADLLLAALICAQPHEKARGMIKRLWRVRWFGIYWGLHCRKLDVGIEAAKFRRYLIAEQTMAPVQPIPREECRPINAPWPWLLFEFLLSTYRMTTSEALNLPICTGNALWALRADADGRINLATAQSSVADLIHAAWRAAHQDNGETTCRN
jgi:hypothetical protein